MLTLADSSINADPFDIQLRRNESSITLLGWIAPPPYNNGTGDESEDPVLPQFHQRNLTSHPQDEPPIDEISPDEDDRAAEMTLRRGGA